jgi:hypothetical protein
MTESKPWICPVCNRGVAPDQKTCDHTVIGLSLQNQVIPIADAPSVWPVWRWNNTSDGDGTILPGVLHAR